MEKRSLSGIIFREPLVVYKYSSEKAYEYCLKIVNHILGYIQVNKIYVEDLEKINLEILKKQNNSFHNYTDSKIKVFEKGISRPDICIIIGGDGTTLWTNHLFENDNKPPFLIFNLGSLGYMAIYSCDQYKEVIDELYNLEKAILFEKRATLQATIFKNNVTKESLSYSRLTSEEFKLPIFQK